MTYSDYTITKVQYTTHKNGDGCEKINEIWENFLSRLPENFREEATKKGFKLVSNPDYPDDPVAEYIMFEIKDATSDLQDFLSQGKVYNNIVCLNVEEEEDEEVYF